MRTVLPEGHVLLVSGTGENPASGGIFACDGTSVARLDPLSGLGIARSGDVLVRSLNRRPGAGVGRRTR